MYLCVYIYIYKMSYIIFKTILTRYRKHMNISKGVPLTGKFLVQMYYHLFHRVH